MPHVLALDQGTTSSRAIVFDAAGRAVATAQREFEQHFPEPGWVEHEAGDLWQTQLDTAREAIAAAGLTAGDIAALGITNQRETTLLWERTTGRPVHRAIVWQDRRTAALCDELRKAGHEPTFQRKTGLRLDPYFAGTKLRWLLDHVPDAQSSGPGGGSWRSARSTPGCSGTSPPGGAMPPTRPTPPARCFTTCTPATGTTDLLTLLDIPRDAAADDPRLQRRPDAYGSTQRPTCSAGRSASPAWRATSRRRCLVRPASPAGSSRTPTARAASCSCTPAKSPSPPSTACSPPSPGRSADGPGVRPRRQRVRRRGGGAVAAGRAGPDRLDRRDGSRSPAASTTAAGWCLSPRLRGWARRTGTRTRGARCWA